MQKHKRLIVMSTKEQQLDVILSGDSHCSMFTDNEAPKFCTKSLSFGELLGGVWLLIDCFTGHSSCSPYTVIIKYAVLLSVYVGPLNY